MAYELIITEKPQAARKIAEALADTKPKKKSSREKVPYYELEYDGKKIIIVSAVGHIYGLSQKKNTPKSKYPVFEIEWVPSSDINKSSKFTKKYLSTIKRLAKDASEFTVATDYDIE
jgi:DNA topoisomerase I